MFDSNELTKKITNGKDRQAYNNHINQAAIHKKKSASFKSDDIRRDHYRRMSLRHLDDASDILSKYDPAFKT
jgi:hypothetical protein